MVALHRPPLDEVDLGLTHSAVRQRLFGEPPRPTRIGRFDVERTVGFGGMGRVYLGTDPDLRRSVAIKLIRAHDDDHGAATLRRRLVREARALAQLSHPNVIVAYEVGTAGDDVFLAMEYAPGVDLRKWLRSPRRWQEIVEVFVQAGRGLAAAHRAGIVHRDFKPGNVLVGDDGRVRVLDFGLALPATEVDGSAATPASGRGAAPAANASTATRGPAGTPGYVAPEVSAGSPADARSDQYSFCVSLHEALLGRRPGADEGARGTGAPAWVTKVTERGLEPDPAARYPTMDALVAALQRDPTARRRTLALLGIAALLGTGAWGWAELERRNDALACRNASEAAALTWNAARAQRVRASFEATEAPIADATATRVTGRLDRHVQWWADARAQACTAAPAAAGCLDRGLAELDVVADLFEHADDDTVFSAVRIASELSPPAGCLDPDIVRRLARAGQPADPEAAADLHRTLTRAAILRAASRRSEALETARSGLTVAQSLDWPPLVVAARHQVGAALVDAGELEDGRAELQVAYRTAQSIGRDDLAIDAAVSLVTVNGTLARYDEAKLWADLGQALLQRLGEPSSARAAMLSYNLGNVHQSEGDPEAAERAYEQALRMRRDVFGDDHPDIAASLIGMGNVALKSGRLDEALTHYQRARSSTVALLGAEHPLALTIADNTASVYREQDRFDEARALYEWAIDARSRVLGPDDPTIATTRHNLGAVYFRQGNLDAAEEQFQRVLAMEQGNLGHDHPAVADALINLAAIAFERGRPSDALEPVKRAIEIRERKAGPQDTELISALSNLAHVYAAIGRIADARDPLTRALEIANARLGPDDLRREPVYVGLADLAEREGDRDVALDFYRRALRILELAGQTQRAKQVRDRITAVENETRSP